MDMGTAIVVFTLGPILIMAVVCIIKIACDEAAISKMYQGRK